MQRLSYVSNVSGKGKAPAFYRRGLCFEVMGKV